MARKMAIIPMDLVSRLQMAAQTDGALNNLARANQKLDFTLQDTSLPPDIQAMKYSNLYTQYNAFKDSNLQRPLEIPLNIPDPPQAPIPPVGGLTDIQIMDGMPQSSELNAGKLLQFIKRNRDIKWNESGEVEVNGIGIPGSNIRNIVHHYSRNFTGRNPAGLRRSVRCWQALHCLALMSKIQKSDR